MADEEFGSMPRITLDDEDIAHHQVRRSLSPRVTGEQPQAGNLPPPERRVIVPDKIIITLAAFSLTAMGGLVWLYLSLQTNTEALAIAVGKIQYLEERLSSTDTTITQSEVLLADKLKSMDQSIGTNKSEIRKLWGLAGDTQRKAIEQEKATNEQQAASIKALQGQLAASDQKNSDQQVLLDQLVVTSKNSESSAREAVQRMELSQEKVNNIESDVKNIKLKQSQQETDYGKRLSALEDTAKSTDVFRRNTQEELRKLREELVRQAAPSTKSNP